MQEILFLVCSSEKERENGCFLCDFDYFAKDEVIPVNIGFAFTKKVSGREGYVWDSRQDTVGIDTPRKEVKAVAAGEIPSPEREAFAPGEGISSSGIGGNHALSLSTHRRRWRAKTAPLPTLFQPSWNQTGAT
jgi:hypothetical protein